MQQAALMSGPLTADEPRNFTGTLVAWIRDANGHTVGRADGSEGEDARVAADATLWAAAPDILAAAEAWIKVHEEWYGRLVDLGILGDGRYGGDAVPDDLWAAETDAFEGMRAAVRAAVVED